MSDYLEDDYKDVYERWQGSTGVEENAEILDKLSPVIDKGVQIYGGAPSALTKSRARRLALQGLSTYDRKRSRLQSHLINHMQGLQRISRQQHNVVNVPERVMMDNQKLSRYTQELSDNLGREPTDSELADKAGVSIKRIKYVREWHPGMTTGQVSSIDPMGSPGAASNAKAHNAWLEIVYDDLGPIDQKIMEFSLGLHGRPQLGNAEIASRLKRTPGAISQRKAKIQQQLRQEEFLSPFI